MKFGFTLLATIVAAEAFTSPIQSPRVPRTTPREKISEELDIPCEEECALKSFPNLPESVHPGVLSGKAMMDLLDHAKENGALVCCLVTLSILEIMIRLLDLTMPDMTMMSML